MRNLGENQNLFQILLIKVNRDMIFFPFNKIYFHIPHKQFFIEKIFRGYDFSILAFYNIADLDKYFGVFGSELRASFRLCLTIECPPPPPKRGGIDLRATSDSYFDILASSPCFVVIVYLFDLVD